MKSLTLREQLKSKLSTMQIKDIRQYHLTHDDYSGLSDDSSSQFDYIQIGADYEALFTKGFDFYSRVMTEDVYENYNIHNYYFDECYGFDYSDDFVNGDYDEFPEKMFLHIQKLSNPFFDLLSDSSQQVQQLNTQPIAVIKSKKDLLARIESHYATFLKYDLEGLVSKSMRTEILSNERINVIKQAIFNNHAGNNFGESYFFDNICMFSEFWIRCPLNWDKREGRSLLQHLFVQYKVPTFITKCWYRSSNQENLQWLLVYITYAQGGSVKQAVKNFDWTVPSQKLWHMLLQVPTGFAPRKAIRHCEIKRLNANNYICEHMHKSEAYSINPLFGDEKNRVDFWYSIIRWLVDNNTARNEIPQVLRWAYHQFTEYKRTGKSYVMDGRSASKVRNKVNEYYAARRPRHRARRRRAAERRRLFAAELNQQTEEIREDTLYNGVFKTYQWNKLGFSWEVPETKWHFIELSSSEELFKEGEVLNHCAASYSKPCFDGEIAIISLRYDGKTKATIEINTKTHSIVQTAGCCNQDVTTSEMKLIITWFKNRVCKVGVA